MILICNCLAKARQKFLLKMASTTPSNGNFARAVAAAAATIASTAGSSSGNTLTAVNGSGLNSGLILSSSTPSTASALETLNPFALANQVAVANMNPAAAYLAAGHAAWPGNADFG